MTKYLFSRELDIISWLCDKFLYDESIYGKSKFKFLYIIAHDLFLTALSIFLMCLYIVFESCLNIGLIIKSKELAFIVRSFIVRSSVRT